MRHLAHLRLHLHLRRPHPPPPPLLLVILVILVIFTFFLVFPLVSLAASVSLIGINVFLYVIFAPLSVGSLRLNIGMVVVFLFLVDTAATRRLLQSV